MNAVDPFLIGRRDALAVCTLIPKTREGTRTKQSSLDRGMSAE